MKLWWIKFFISKKLDLNVYNTIFLENEASIKKKISVSFFLHLELSFIKN